MTEYTVLLFSQVIISLIVYLLTVNFPRTQQKIWVAGRSRALSVHTTYLFMNFEEKYFEMIISHSNHFGKKILLKLIIMLAAGVGTWHIVASFSYLRLRCPIKRFFSAEIKFNEYVVHHITIYTELLTATTFNWYHSDSDVLRTLVISALHLSFYLPFTLKSQINICLTQTFLSFLLRNSNKKEIKSLEKVM